MKKAIINHAAKLAGFRADVFRAQIKAKLSRGRKCRNTVHIFTADVLAAMKRDRVFSVQ